MLGFPNPAPTVRVASKTPQVVFYSGAGVPVPQTFAGSNFFAPRVIRGTDGYAQYIGSVDTTANTITLLYGDPRPAIWETVTIVSSLTLPAPLQAGVTYYPRNITSNTTLQLSATPDGPIIDLTTAGSGTMYFNAYMTDLGCAPVVARGLDSGLPVWSGVNTSNGVYDWTIFDAYVDYHFTQRGRQLILTLSSTPLWAARNSAPDAYGTPGGGQVPTLLTSTSAWVTAVLARFNAGASKPFFAVEVWNEPSFAATGTSGQNWCGTMAELAQTARLVNQAAKSVDSGILVLSPGFTSGLAGVPPSVSAISMYGWLLASDGAAGSGKNWVDGVCYHGYDMTQSGLTQLAAEVTRYRGILSAAGLSASFPLYQTERGLDVGANNSLTHIRCLAIEASQGVRHSSIYNFDSYGVNPRSYNELRTALNAFYYAVCGKTMTYCALNQDGTVTVTANGSTFTW